MSKARQWGRGATIALAIALIIVSFLPLWWTDHWWVRMWDFPRLQVAALLVLVGVGLCGELSGWRENGLNFGVRVGHDCERSHRRLH